MGKFAIILVKEGDICNINFNLGKYAIKQFFKGKYAIVPKKNVRRFAGKVDRRTCFKCQEVGHIAWNCSKTNYTKQGVSSNSNLKKTSVDKKKQSVNIVKKFENSSSEKGESKKRFYKRRGDLSKEKWIVKSESSSDNESDSIKSEESLVEKQILSSVPE